MNTPADLSPLLEAFFTQRLIAQRKVSPHTINSYRDTFRLLLKFAERRLRCPPSKLTLENLAAPFLAAFLDHLEADRANGPRTRNLRLAAIHSFFRYAALEAPQHAGLIQRVLAIPRKRYSRALVDFLTRPEIEALLAVVNPHTWIERRDHAFLLTAVQTGLGLSELTSLRQQDVWLALARMSVVKERAERSVALRWRNRPQRSSTPGSNTKERMHLVSCSRAHEADDSVPTRFSISWPNMLELRKRYVLRSLIKTLARMCFDTPQPWKCCKPASIDP